MDLKRFGKVTISLNKELTLEVEIGKVGQEFHTFIRTGLEGKERKGTKKEPGYEYLIAEGGLIQVNE